MPGLEVAPDGGGDVDDDVGHGRHHSSLTCISQPGTLPAVSSYEGTEAEQSYWQGYAAGCRAGEFDRREASLLITENIEAGRSYLELNLRRPSRAYHVAWLRGYREQVRT